MMSIFILHVGPLNEYAQHIHYSLKIFGFSETTYRGSTNTETQYSQEKAIIKSATHKKKKQKDGK